MTEWEKSKSDPVEIKKKGDRNKLGRLEILIWIITKESTRNRQGTRLTHIN